MKQITVKQLNSILKKNPNALLWLHGDMASGKTHTALELFPGAPTLAAKRATTSGLMKVLCAPHDAVIVEFEDEAITPEWESLARSFYSKAIPVKYHPDREPKKFLARQLVLTSLNPPMDASLASRCVVVRCVRKKAGRSSRFSLCLESQLRRN